MTLSIIGDLRLNWPPSVKYVTSSLSISGMLGIDFINPACILRQFGRNGFAIFTMARLLVMFMVLFGTSTVSVGCSTLRRCCYPGSARLKKYVDVLEFAQSIVFAMQLTGSWKACAQLMLAFDWGELAARQSIEDRTLSISGVSLVSVMLILQIFVVGKYYLMMYKLRTEGSFELVGLTPERLNRRLEYLCSRYSEKTKYHWQFVIWFRLLLLTCVTLVPDAVSEVSRMLDRSKTVTAENLQQEQSRDVFLIWVHAIVACVFLFVFAVWHLRASPFNYRFQNVIETALFAADVLTIALGVAYTWITMQDDAAGAHPVIESLLILVIGGSIVSAMVYLFIRYRKDLVVRIAAEREQRGRDDFRSRGRQEYIHDQEHLHRLRAKNDRIAVRKRTVSGSSLRASAASASSPAKRMCAQGLSISNASPCPTRPATASSSNSGRSEAGGLGLDSMPSRYRKTRASLGAGGVTPSFFDRNAPQPMGPIPQAPSLRSPQRSSTGSGRFGRFAFSSSSGLSRRRRCPARRRTRQGQPQ